MDTVFMHPGEADRSRRLRKLVWIAPLALIVGAAFFYGVGKLVVWLWSQTVVDLFGFKAISFWQAWGLILLSQILFKANIQPTARTGRWRRRRHWRWSSPGAEPQPSSGSPSGPNP